MVSLRGMTEEEFQAFLGQLIPEYAAEKVQAGNWTSGEALDRSREELRSLLPRGLASSNQHLYSIEWDGTPAGRLWLSVDRRDAGHTGFLYDLFVAEPFRRHGVATEAMRLLESEAARLGIRTLASTFSDSTVFLVSCRTSYPCRAFAPPLPHFLP